MTEVDILHPTKHTTTFKVKVRHYDKHRDVAVLEHVGVPAHEYHELEPAPEPAAVRDQVIAVGYPGWGLGERLNVRSGEVSTLTVRSAVQLIEVTQQLAKGMSGGPILNADGNVVGIIHKGGHEEDRQFAIKLSELDASLKAAVK
jgi:S1-C subfamily serine protease